LQGQIRKIRISFAPQKGENVVLNQTDVSWISFEVNVTGM